MEKSEIENRKTNKVNKTTNIKIQIDILSKRSLVQDRKIYREKKNRLELPGVGGGNNRE
jgi:hypothetical protein